MFTFKALLLATIFNSSAATSGSSGCACLTAYPSGLLDESTKKTGAEAAYGDKDKLFKELSAISSYGLSSCAAHDKSAGTPWYEFCGIETKGFCSGPDFANGDDNWCALPWCYVDGDTCDKAKMKTDVFCPKEGDCSGAANTLYYSYETCSAPDCYNEFTALAYNGTCPYTDTDDVTLDLCKGTDEDSCYCLGAVPDSIMDGMDKKDEYKEMIDTTSYGSKCDDWDDVTGTPWYAAYCDPDKVEGYDMCAANNWCVAQWCYINPKTCDTAVKTSVMAPTNAHYSYLTCGEDADCYTDAKADGCPTSPKANGCEDEFGYDCQSDIKADKDANSAHIKDYCESVKADSGLPGFIVADDVSPTCTKTCVSCWKGECVTADKCDDPKRCRFCESSACADEGGGEGDDDAGGIFVPSFGILAATLLAFLKLSF